MKRIYVGNLSYDTTDEGLERAFAEFGAVNNVQIMRDRETGRSRGFAFVEMASADEADAAIQGMNDAMLDGRNLKVNEARPREDRGGRGGGGGRRDRY